VITPLSTLLATTRAVQQVLSRIAQDGTPISAVDDLPGLNEFVDLVGMAEIQEIGDRFGRG
jgi:2-methylisocitrate lyase-like PEP mutase family enzyme